MSGELSSTQTLGIQITLNEVVELLHESHISPQK